MILTKGCTAKLKLYMWTPTNLNEFRRVIYVIHYVMLWSLYYINVNTTASERQNTVKHAMEAAVESTIGQTASAAKRDVPYCADIAMFACAEQRKLRLWLQSTSYVTRRWELKRQHNTILHSLRRQARDKAEARLDNLAWEVERLRNVRWRGKAGDRQIEQWSSQRSWQ